MKENSNRVHCESTSKLSKKNGKVCLEINYSFEMSLEEATRLVKEMKRLVLLNRFILPFLRFSISLPELLKAHFDTDEKYQTAIDQIQMMTSLTMKDPDQ